MADFIANGAVFDSIPRQIRLRIYYLLVTVSARLPERPAIRYARFGIPVNAMLINKKILKEITKFLVTKNTFNVVVGHRIVEDTVISPLPYGHLPTPPNLAWIERLHLTIEVDLDKHFASAHPPQLLSADENENIFEGMQTLSGIIRTTSLSSLRSIAISIHEIIDPKKRIHVTCDINEIEVRERYAEIIRPLRNLHLPDGLVLEDIDAIYGDGYTIEGGKAADWTRADDYIMLFKEVLYDFGCYESPRAALRPLVR